MAIINNFINLNIRNILLLAIFLRVLWAYIVPVDPVADSFLYNEFAKSIASGNGYAFPNGDITVYWPVGTSAIYAVLYKVFGVSFLPIVLLNIVIGGLVVWLTFKIAERYIGNKVALLSASFVAIWPILIEFTTILASELIFILLVLSALYFWGSKNFHPILRATLWGAFISFATYVRPTAFLILVMLPVAEFLLDKKLKASILSFLIAALTAAIFFSPWVYRNQQVFGEFVLVSANGGVNLWMGNNPKSNGGYTELPDLIFKSEVIRDKYYKQEAIKFILDNPLNYIKLAIKRSYITYKAETIGVLWNGYLEKNYNKSVLLGLKLISSFYWWVILLLACAGSYYTLKDKKLTLVHPLIMLPGFFLLFPILTVGQDRYHLPLNPFLAIFAAYYINNIIQKLNYQKTMLS
jgi:4-amino-4-deoxy-L-arabinose transferase-like glycosyltransferase